MAKDFEPDIERVKRMINLSKSKYCGLWQCPKIPWLQKYRPEKQTLSVDARARMVTGSEVGELARGLLGDSVDVTAYDGERLDLRRMIEETEKEMNCDTAVICEASFSYNGLYCAVDLLKRENSGWAIYEIKSSTHDDKEVYIADVVYQKYVLEHCEVCVTKTYLVVLNSDYVRGETLNLWELFRIVDISNAIEEAENSIEDNIALARQYLEDPEEPPVDLSLRCRDPYPCSFWDYCTRDICSPSVFDLYRMHFKKQLDYYRDGLISFQDLNGLSSIKNDKQRRQIEYALSDKGNYIDRDSIRIFLQQLHYPLYFLDFETIMPAIPRFPGTKPYTQLPFQYSLHYIESEGGELKHKEFLAEAGTDPRRGIAERLCEDIPIDACVTAYNKSFECTRLKELAEAFPDLKDHLLQIRDNIVDLLVPFQSGWYYNRAMGGSFSIKSVLPALFPDDPTLDYHNLEEIHNGSEAMNAFPAMEHMPPEEQNRIRCNLLKYCKLDTYAMVKVWQRLVEVAG